MELTLESFKPLLNDTFIIPFKDADDWELKLSEVNEFPDQENQSRKRFSVIFKHHQTDKDAQQLFHIILILFVQKYNCIPLAGHYPD